MTSAGALACRAAHAYLELARKIPGAAAVEAELHRLERVALAELRRRLDGVDPLGAVEPPPAGEGLPAPAATPPPTTRTEPLRATMAELLLRSMEQTAQRAREYLYLALLRLLVPDEARILAALADGSAYPVVHVDCRTGVAGTERLLSNASTVGRAAGAADLAAVPRYLGRLLHLGLVELGDVDPDLSVAYDILLTDGSVRTAEEAARTRGRPRIVRRTVVLSPLGRELWDACHPREALDATWAVDEPDVPEPVTPHAGRNGSSPAPV